MKPLILLLAAVAASGQIVTIPNTGGDTVRLNLNNNFSWIATHIPAQVACAGSSDATAIAAALATASEVTTTGVCVMGAALTIPKGKVLRLGPGAHTVSGISFTDSTTDATGAGRLIGAGNDETKITLANSVNGDVVRQVNFSTLTGGSSVYGCVGCEVRDITIDGNKANQTAGYGIRLYGRRIRFANVRVQNCKQDGILTEGHEDAAYVTGDASGELFADNVQVAKTNGNGWTYKGPNDGRVHSFISWGNTGWGIDITAPLNLVGYNGFLNTSGAARVDASGALAGSNNQFTSDPGFGLLVGSTSGLVNLSASTYSAINGVGLELRSSQHSIHGQVSNSITGVKFNGGSGVLLELIMFGITGNYFDCTTMNGAPVIIASNLDSGGTPWAANCNGPTAGPSNATILTSFAATNGKQVNFPTRTLHAGGWAPVLPQSNATMATIDDSAQVGTFYSAKYFSSGDTFANLGTPTDGTWGKCTNCNTPATPGATCATGGDNAGAIAFRIRSGWKCF